MASYAPEFYGSVLRAPGDFLGISIIISIMLRHRDLGFLLPILNVSRCDKRCLKPVPFVNTNEIRKLDHTNFCEEREAITQSKLRHYNGTITICIKCLF